MDRTRFSAPSGSLAAAVAAFPRGPRIAFDRDGGGAAEFKSTVEEVRRFAEGAVAEFKKLGQGQEAAQRGLEAADTRMTAIEQKMARRGGGGGDVPDLRSVGERFIQSDEYKSFADTVARSNRGSTSLVLETKTVINPMTTAVGSGNALVVPDYDPGITGIPMRPMTIRRLLNARPTSGNTIYYTRQTVRNLNAAIVPEGQLKPQSDLQYDRATVSVETIAHFIQASRQILDDADQVRAEIDGELTYGVDYAEENQLLYGDGTGNNLFGLIPQATAFAPPFSVAGQTRIDVINQAVAQSEMALLPATGIVMNTLDWRAILNTKDGQGRYLVGDPIGPQPRNIWNLPVAATLAMAPGTFLVGAFGIGAQLYDRMLMEILASTEDGDNFRRNLVTIRGERRVALAVKRPQAFIFGQFPNN